MHYEAHDTSGKDIVAHVCIPSRPQLFEVVELEVVLGYLVELVPVCVLGVREHGIGNRVIGRIVEYRAHREGAH